MQAYKFMGVAMTQWAKHLDLYGKHVLLCVVAENETAARRAFSRTLLRPLCHPDDFVAEAEDDSLDQFGTIVHTYLGPNHWVPAQLPKIETASRS